jgi:branched-chain amino acid transport system ATP-binding protein
LRPAEYLRIVEVLRELNKAGLTILLIEHVMRVVMSLADHVVVLHHGQKMTEGTPDAVTRDPRTIESYLGKKARA